MNVTRFHFYVEGLEQTWIVPAETEKSARERLWRELNDSQRNLVVQIECFDEDQGPPMVMTADAA